MGAAWLWPVFRPATEYPPEISPRTQAGDPAGGPGFGQRRQQLDFAGVGLQQHLADAGGVAEVAVDLERRVGVEEVCVHAAAVPVVHARVADEPQQVADEFVGAVAVVQARPEVDLPGGAPAGAHVAARVERDPRRLGQLPASSAA